MVQLIVLYFQKKYGYDFYCCKTKKITIFNFLIPFDTILQDNTNDNYIFKLQCPICLKKLIPRDARKNLKMI